MSASKPSEERRRSPSPDPWRYTEVEQREPLRTFEHFSAEPDFHPDETWFVIYWIEQTCTTDDQGICQYYSRDYTGYTDSAKLAHAMKTYGFEVLPFVLSRVELQMVKCDLVENVGEKFVQVDCSGHVCTVDLLEMGTEVERAADKQHMEWKLNIIKSDGERCGEEGSEMRAKGVKKRANDEEIYLIQN